MRFFFATIIKKLIIYKKPLLFMPTIAVLLVLSNCNGSDTRFSKDIAAEVPKAHPNFELLANEQSSYNGSQAYTTSLFTAEEVSSNSGSLNIGKTLISTPGITKNINLNLSIIYSTSDLGSGKHILHMPHGWNLQLSYVIPDKSVNIDGSNYVIDYKWADESGYNSGLKYVNNHGIKFTDVGVGKLSCKLDDREYRYIYSNTDGSHQYFDATGKLIARDNNFGSCISYYYVDNGDMYSSYLDKIIDSYGQEFDIKYGIGHLVVSNNNKLLAKVLY